MISKKQIKETYMNKWYGGKYGGKYGDTVTAIAFDGDYAILMSGSWSPYESGYCIEAVIDRKTGENIAEGHSRPCEDKSDAIDVAHEMIEF